MGVRDGGKLTGSESIYGHTLMNYNVLSEDTLSQRNSAGGKALALDMAVAVMASSSPQHHI